MTASNLYGKIVTTIESHFVACAGAEPGMLNKITGCESRTVPPLYVLTVLPFGESRSLGNWEGGQDRRVSQPLQGTSQKTYGMSSPILCVFTEGVLVAEKRLRHHFWCRSRIIFQEETL